MLNYHSASLYAAGTHTQRYRPTSSCATHTYTHECHVGTRPQAGDGSAFGSQSLVVWWNEWGGWRARKSRARKSNWKTAGRASARRGELASPQMGENENREVLAVSFHSAAYFARLCGGGTPPMSLASPQPLRGGYTLGAWAHIT